MKLRRKPPQKSIAKREDPEPAILRIRWTDAPPGEFQTLNLAPQETLLTCLVRNEIPMFSSCGGFGTCGTCRVRVLIGNEFLAPPNFVEAELAQDRNFQSTERLTCQSELNCELTIRSSSASTLNRFSEIEIEIPRHKPK